MPKESEHRISRIDLAGAARLVSDLHLQPELTAITERFERFLDRCVADRIDAIFLLGDLFEYWIGDDCAGDIFVGRVAARLRSTAAAGIRIFFLAGNRDFLLGPEFARQCGMALLADTAMIVSAGGTAIQIMHGDTLCTDDLAYQKFRAMVREPQWQDAFLSHPLPERLAEVARLRQHSKKAMQNKSAEIMDVNANAVATAFRTAEVSMLVHGHTHRPGVETSQVDGRACERWVLSDWTTTRADAIEFSDDHLRRINLLVE